MGARLPGPGIPGQGLPRHRVTRVQGLPGSGAAGSGKPGLQGAGLRQDYLGLVMQGYLGPGPPPCQSTGPGPPGLRAMGSEGHLSLDYLGTCNLGTGRPWVQGYVGKGYPGSTELPATVLPGCGATQPGIHGLWDTRTWDRLVAGLLSQDYLGTGPPGTELLGPHSLNQAAQAHTLTWCRVGRTVLSALVGSLVG